MRLVDELKDRRRLEELLDPNAHRLKLGTPGEREQARSEWRRHKRIARIVNSERDEIPRSDLTFIRHGLLEHEPTGRWFRKWNGDPDFADGIPAYYVTESGDPVLLEPAGSRQEFEQKRAEREARRVAQEAARRERWKRIKAGA